jgi:hypothetical protein
MCLGWEQLRPTPEIPHRAGPRWGLRTQPRASLAVFLGWEQLRPTPEIPHRAGPRWGLRTQPRASLAVFPNGPKTISDY